MFKIIFNSNTSAYATKDREANLTFLRCQARFINDMFKCRDYVYVNTIYELLGVKWNPEWTNHCYAYQKVKAIEFRILRNVEDGFEIDID